MKFTQFLTTASLASSATAQIGFSNSTINSTASTQKHYAILDNDWSPAGFIPFLIALKGGIEVLALSSSTSNTWQKQCAYHALATLEVGNLSCIPVYNGPTHPLLRNTNEFQAWEAVHGKLPWEGVFAPYNATAEALGSDPTGLDSDANRISPKAFTQGYPNTSTIANISAAQFMIESVHKYPNQVSIYAAGAMTTVALAIRMDDTFASLAKELVIMGGYVDVNMYQVTGDTNQADLNSDINLMVDPEAAQIALRADFPRIVVAGNVANQLQSTQAFLDEIYEVKNPYSKLTYDLYGTLFPFWDETAAALMVDPSIATNTTTAYIDVDTAYGSPNYGNIHLYQKALMPPGLRNVTYVNTIDIDRFKAMIKEAVQYPVSCADL